MGVQGAAGATKRWRVPEKPSAGQGEFSGPFYRPASPARCRVRADPL